MSNKMTTPIRELITPEEFDELTKPREKDMETPTIDTDIPVPPKVHKNGSRMKIDWIYETLQAMEINQSVWFADKETAYKFYSRGANWTSIGKWNRKLIIREITDPEAHPRGVGFCVWRIEDVQPAKKWSLDD